ncbi:MAG: hypothetical protein M1268_02150 [Patescibacteria group bacterium]|nr:hypothetical protein [Patescibacteria group bacterium]
MDQEQNKIEEKEGKQENKNYVKIPTQLFIFIGLAVLLIIILIVGFYLGSNYGKNNQKSAQPTPVTKVSPTIQVTLTSTQITPTVSLPESSNPNVKRFISDILGISFTYLENQDNGKILAKEVGNKVYVYPSNLPETTGQYVEVMSKDKNNTLEQALRKSILKGYSQANCLLKPVNLNNGNPDYVTIEIVVPITDNDDLSTIDEKAKKCPPKYTATNGQAYFLEDKNHPDRMLFFSIGQYAIMSEGGKTWQETIKIFK